MNTYRVSVVFRILETYEVEAENAEAAASSWTEGQRIPDYRDEYPLETTVVNVTEIQP